MAVSTQNPSGGCNDGSRLCQNIAVDVGLLPLPAKRRCGCLCSGPICIRALVDWQQQWIRKLLPHRSRRCDTADSHSSPLPTSLCKRGGDTGSASRFSDSVRRCFAIDRTCREYVCARHACSTACACTAEPCVSVGQLLGRGRVWKLPPRRDGGAPCYRNGDAAPAHCMPCNARGAWHAVTHDVCRAQMFHTPEFLGLAAEAARKSLAAVLGVGKPSRLVAATPFAPSTLAAHELYMCVERQAALFPRCQWRAHTRPFAVANSPWQHGGVQQCHLPLRARPVGF